MYICICEPTNRVGYGSFSNSRFCLMMILGVRVKVVRSWGGGV